MQDAFEGGFSLREIFEHRPIAEAHKPKPKKKAVGRLRELSTAELPWSVGENWFAPTLTKNRKLEQKHCCLTLQACLPGPLILVLFSIFLNRSIPLSWATGHSSTDTELRHAWGQGRCRGGGDWRIQEATTCSFLAQMGWMLHSGCSKLLRHLERLVFLFHITYGLQCYFFFVQIFVAVQT